MNGISIIVPTLNEEKNVKNLCERIHRSVSKTGTPYEIIFVDDFSTDATGAKIKMLAKTYPISLHVKRGSRGKAQSILEGCAYAKYDVYAFIDADLQYPPEALPAMIASLTQNNADVVVTNRKLHHTNPFRKYGSKANRFVFGRLMFGLPYDTQSGMKLFKKQVIETMDIKPTPWSFDLEFLVKARSAGYSIESVDIAFQKRSAGESKVSMTQVATELIISSLALKWHMILTEYFTPAKRFVMGE